MIIILRVYVLVVRAINTLLVRCLTLRNQPHLPWKDVVELRNEREKDAHILVKHKHFHCHRCALAEFLLDTAIEFSDRSCLAIFLCCSGMAHCHEVAASGRYCLVQVRHW